MDKSAGHLSPLHETSKQVKERGEKGQSGGSVAAKWRSRAPACAVRGGVCSEIKTAARLVASAKRRKKETKKIRSLNDVANTDVRCGAHLFLVCLAFSRLVNDRRELGGRTSSGICVVPLRRNTFLVSFLRK